jgi:hypothetical protein
VQPRDFEGGRRGWRCGWRYAQRERVRRGGQRERVRGEYMFSSLMKQKIKGKNCAVFCFAGKRRLLFLYL